MSLDYINGRRGSRVSNSDDSDDSDDSGDSTELYVVSVKAINNKQVEIKFSVEIDKDSAQDEANYIIRDNGTVDKTLTYNSCKLGDDRKTVTITLDSTIQDCLTNSSRARVIVSKDIMAADERNC